MTVSSKFAGDVYVNYEFSFTPSYRVPAGSKISISLPNRGDLNYLHIGNSNPPAECITNING